MGKYRVVKGGYSLLWVLPILVIVSLHCSAQQYDSVYIRNIELDSFTVKSNFDMKAFMRRVQNDTTFYKAFKSLHLVPFTATNSFTAYDKSGVVVAAMNNKAQQKINAKGCRTSIITDERATGDFYKKNREFNYYTARLFYDAFYSATPVCNQSDIVAGALEQHGSGRMEKNKYELKQLIFNPGSRVKGVPFMGDRASVFDEDEVDKYIFKVSQEIYDGQDCYVFSVTPKPDYIHAVVYNELKTWFRRSDFSILARDYSLSFSTMFYDFNVRMKVRTKEIGGKLYPVHIDYDGEWHVATKKRERMRVVMDVVY